VTTVPIEAVLFDLDDTLFPQAAWLEGAWARVAEVAAADGVPRAQFTAALNAVAAEGTDRGRIIDRALAVLGRSDIVVGGLVEAFRSHAPTSLLPYPGVPGALESIRAKFPMALVTDGDVRAQEAKLAALGLDRAFDVVVFSDELGRDQRKPHPAPFVAALHDLGVPAHAAVFVGDRPDKDVAGADAAGMPAIRVRTGEYRDAPDGIAPWATVPDAVAAIDFVLTRSRGERAARRVSRRAGSRDPSGL
jgi:putative hydrolase of the HAD superfamily